MCLGLVLSVLRNTRGHLKGGYLAERLCASKVTRAPSRTGM